MVVADHAEFLGLITSCLDPESSVYDDIVCQNLRDDPDMAFMTINAQFLQEQDKADYPRPCKEDGCREYALSAWKQIKDAAEAAYDRTPACTLTTFVGYEWSATPGNQNLHRNVIFRNHQVPELPVSYFDQAYEEGLWSTLRKECLEDLKHCDVLTIPHNSNLSAGLMFRTVDSEGNPFNSEYARERAFFEPLVEMFQHKGDSECLPGMGAMDELCGFEKMPYNTLATANLGINEAEPVPMDYLRYVLGEGLRLEAELNVNPFAYGFIASTDTHLATSGMVDELTFFGHGGAGPSARFAVKEGLPDNAWFNPGGLAVLWAEENSREALFEAMRRREAYGTSGPRIVLRFFGGLDYSDDLCESDDLVATGYQKGVPMGGELSAKSDQDRPRFIVSALMDPGTSTNRGVPLQRLQIIKGWLQEGEAYYQVFDVAGFASDGADVGANCEPIGDGYDSLCTVWTDDGYQKGQRAFYYARVVQNPTCRWHAYYCIKGGVDCADPSTIGPGFEDCCNDFYPHTIQERAWSSPIWVR
jgi:hypothetical protein